MQLVRSGSPEAARTEQRGALANSRGSMLSSRFTTSDVTMIAVSAPVFASVLVGVWRNWLTGFTGSLRLSMVAMAISQLLLISGGIASRDLGRVIAGTLLLLTAVILLVSSLRPTRETGS